MADLAPELDSYLKGKKSPLAGFGSIFVATGKKYGVDPRLVVGISGAESSFGKYIYGANNAWGWGPGIPFGSWEEAIATVTRGLKTGYLDQGLKTLPQIAAKYAPASAGNDVSTWVSNVASFMKELGASPGSTTIASTSAPPTIPPSPSASGIPAPQLDPASLGLGLLSSNPNSALRNLTFKLATTPPVSSPPPTSVPTPGAAVSAPVDDVSKWVTEAPGADRQGVPTKPAVFTVVAGIAQVFGKPLVIGTGSKHNQFVLGSDPPRQSQHWTGDAADIPATGNELTRLGRAALMYAGMSPAEAAQQNGGVYNLGGLQILFNTMSGGNHFNHLHVGVK